MFLEHNTDTVAGSLKESIPVTEAINPRESMRALPRFAQPFLTWLTGMPLIDEKPLVVWTPVGRSLVAFVIAISGLLLSCLILRSGDWWLFGLPVSWLITANGIRDLYTVTEHYCIHDTYSKVHWVDVLVGEVISTVLLAAPVDLFRTDHLKHHSVARLDSDPDVLFLKSTGFHRGMTRQEFRAYIARTCISPVYHGRYLWSRIVSNLTAPAHRVAMTIAYMVILCCALTFFRGWTVWTVIWIVPDVFLFQVASLVNYHSEHLWDDVSGATGREAIARVCVGRFCGEPVPATDGQGNFARFGLWAIWWLRIFIVHLPHRLLILPGDQSQHDLHHRRPRSDWANAAFVRRDDVLAGAPGWPIGYIDVWGSVVDHLDACVDPYRSTKIVRHAPTASRAPPR